MQLLETWQSTVATNLANASTPGYQKAVFSVSAEAGTSQSGNAAAAGVSPKGAVGQSYLDGAIRSTGNPNDFTTQKSGFFALSGPGGQQLYTKDGEFHLDSEGVLVNKMGYAVQAEGGSLNVDLQKGLITAMPDGTISQDGQSVGKLAVFTFNNPQALVRASGSYFQDINGDAGATPMEEPGVLQGHLMGSSVAPLGEMVSMIQVSRAYEMSQKLIRESDERLDRAIQAFSI